MKIPNRKLLTLSLLILNGCSTGGNKILDQKLAKESPITTRSELRTEARTSIANASDLTDEQKLKLTDLRFSVSKQSDDFDKQSLELRSILLKDMLATNYNPTEVNLIKDRMRKLEDQRLSMIFESADKANAIMGRKAPRNHLIMGEFLGERNYRE